LSKKDREREKKKWSCGKDKWTSKITTSEMEKIAVIITKNLSTRDCNQQKKNDNGRKGRRKALLKRNQEKFFDEA